MAMNEDRLVALLIRRLSGELTPEETQELDEWAAESLVNRQFLTRVLNERILEKELNQWKQLDPAEGHTRWVAYHQARRRVRVLSMVKWSAAASLLIAVSISAWFKLTGPHKKPADVVAMNRQPAIGDHNSAVLTLADGRKIVLDSVGKGQLEVQGVTRLIKSDSNSLAYTGREENDAAAVVLYNTLTTPKGRIYQLRLPDGSHVWLNDVSSIRYPTAFNGKDRTVEVSGEAYFEIAGNAAKPFIVKVKDQSVEVLGTSFDIMAYPDEGATLTTLVSGAVKVNTTDHSVRLKPDDQSQVVAGSQLKVLHDVPARSIIAWKDGFFYFGHAPFAAIMRQVARWYDVEVIYEGKMPEIEFGGSFDRDLPLNELLRYLEKNQVHCRLEGHKLFVLPS
jgi:transmembrane sensor